MLTDTALRKLKPKAAPFKVSDRDGMYPKYRTLSPPEIRLMVQEMDAIPTSPTIRLALRMILLPLVRQAELLKATWDEVDFEAGVWSIPKERMKRRFPTMCICPDRRSTFWWHSRPVPVVPSTCCRPVMTVTSACPWAR